MNRPCCNLHARQEGQTLVEFAIAFPIQLLIILGIIQLSMIFVAKQVINYAAFSAARAELVKADDVENEDREQNAAKAASIVCTGIAGPSAKRDIAVTREAFPVMQLPGWGLLVPPPSRARRTHDPAGTNPLGPERAYYTPTRQSEDDFLASGKPDKSCFAQAKTYVYRLDGHTWTCVSGQDYAPDVGSLPMLEQVASQLGDDDRAVVVAVAHDYELAFPFVGEFFAFLTTLNPRLAETEEDEESGSSVFSTPSERWGAPHVTLVDVGVQYRSIIAASGVE